MANANTIITTLERVAETTVDLTDRIYARVCELRPEFERIFFFDRDCGVRGSMLQTSFECMIGIAEQNEMARYPIEVARLHHDGYWVHGDHFDAMFIAMQDVSRDPLGSELTPAVEPDWDSLLIKLARIR